jgi:hypothetical protein
MFRDQFFYTVPIAIGIKEETEANKKNRKTSVNHTPICVTEASGPARQTSIVFPPENEPTSVF